MLYYVWLLVKHTPCQSFRSFYDIEEGGCQIFTLVPDAEQHTAGPGLDTAQWECRGMVAWWMTGTVHYFPL